MPMNGYLITPIALIFLTISGKPEFFVTEGKRTVEIIRTQEIQPGNLARLRGIQSYRLVVQQQDLMTRGDNSWSL